MFASLNYLREDEYPTEKTRNSHPDSCKVKVVGKGTGG